MGRKKNENKVQWKGMPTFEEDLKKIKAAIDSTYEDYQMISQARESLNAIFEDIHAKTGIPRRIFNFLARSNYTGTGHEIIYNNTVLLEAYEAIERLDHIDTEL